MKITQKQVAFYKLYSERNIDPERYVPAWEFIGEILVKELSSWVLMSYKCPARLSDIMRENPGLLERHLIKGKSGSTYYGYRISLTVTKYLLKEESLKEIHRAIKKYE